MSKNEKVENWGKCLVNLLIIGAFLVNIKSIFTDYDVDVEYAVAMAYRMARGERMFIDLWAAQQTSDFLCCLFTKLYLFITNTKTGLVLYLNLAGFICYSIVVYFFYKTIKHKLSPLLGKLITLFLFVVRVKDVQIMEFANMQIMFSILLITCLLKYYEDEKKKGWLVLGAFALCAEIVSYPSCIIVFLIVLLIVNVYSSERIKDMAIFGGVCIAAGISYIIYFLYQTSFSELMIAIRHIIAFDDYHNSNIENKESYFTFFNQGIVWMFQCLCISVAVTFVIRYIYKLKTKKRGGEYKSPAILGIFAVSLLLSDIFLVIVKRERFTYLVTYLLIIAIACVGYKYCSKEERKIICIGGFISLGSFLATMSLTDLDFLSVVRYLVVAVAIAMIPIGKLLDRHYGLKKSDYIRYLILIMFVAAIIFRRGFMFKGNSFCGFNLFDIGGIVKSGPELGIITEYFAAYNKNQSMVDWSNYINPGESLLLVGNETVNCINYLYQDVIISNPSVISTPTYNEEMLVYWEQYPDKYPDVIAVDCWFGELHVPEDSWIMQWINNNYTPYETTDGTYWRFYRMKK